MTTTNGYISLVCKKKAITEELNSQKDHHLLLLLLALFHLECCVWNCVCSQNDQKKYLYIKHYSVCLFLLLLFLEVVLNNLSADNSYIKKEKLY